MTDRASDKLRRRATSFTNDHTHLLTRPNDKNGISDPRARSIRIEVTKVVSAELRNIADELEREGQ